MAKLKVITPKKVKRTNTIRLILIVFIVAALSLLAVTAILTRPSIDNANQTFNALETQRAQE